MQVWQMAENIYNDEETETPANELEWYQKLVTTNVARFFLILNDARCIDGVYKSKNLKDLAAVPSCTTYTCF